MSDEFNKGYFSHGPQSTHDARMGQWARREDDRREAEERDRERARREDDDRSRRQAQEQLALSRGGISGPVWQGNSQGASASSQPATLSGCVKGLALAGAVLAVLYALFGRNVSGLGPLASWAVQGALGGAAGGVVVYAVILVLRVVVAVVAFLIKIALWAALVSGGIYLLMRAV